MRTYRLEIRMLQIAVVMTIIVMLFGVVSAWRGTTDNPPVDTPGQVGELPSDPGQEPGEDPGQDPADQTPANTKLVCLGDSFTVGYPGDSKDSWPQHVADILQVEVINAGKVHQNASDLLQRFDQDVVLNEPGRVVIFAGIGDALRGIPLEDYQTNVKALVEKARANHIEPILALPIPFPGTKELNEAYREWEIAYAQENNIKVLDFKEVLFNSEGNMKAEYSSDGRYPNKAGYKAMGEYAARVLQ